VDDDAAFVTSANFTDWAQHRNVEAGVLVRDRQLVAQVRGQFVGLVRTQQVRRIPGL
jgi:phosphatidylserine/phosphatidylglycerophosphate/cardiolipin synthase-like enzyme